MNKNILFIFYLLFSNLFFCSNYALLGGVSIQTPAAEQSKSVNELLKVPSENECCERIAAAIHDPEEVAKQIAICRLHHPQVSSYNPFIKTEDLWLDKTAKYMEGKSPDAKVAVECYKKQNTMWEKIKAHLLSGGAGVVALYVFAAVVGGGKK